MTEATQDRDFEQARIMLGLLNSVERDGGQSQRRLASDLGIALGLVNAYLKRCVKKGLVKANQAPARRYVYYLTPRGFSEKSRLTIEYLSYSFRFFREAKNDCAVLVKTAQAKNFSRVVFAGKSDLAEIASLCVSEAGITVVAIVDPAANAERFLGVPVFKSWTELTQPFDCIIVTDLVSTRPICQQLLKNFETERVLIPALLRQRLRPAREKKQ